MIRERFVATAAAVPAVLRATDADTASAASPAEGAQAASLHSSFSTETSVFVYESRLRCVCDGGTSTCARHRKSVGALRHTCSDLHSQGRRGRRRGGIEASASSRWQTTNRQGHRRVESIGSRNCDSIRRCSPIATVDSHRRRTNRE